MIKELISELNTDGKKLSFFCGAGISRNSGIPTVNDTYVRLSELLTDGQEDAKLLFNLLDVWNEHKKNELPFESIMQELIADTGSYSFLDMYKLGKPNSNHFLITLLAIQEKVNWIVTTNFDLLFERAFELLGWQNGKEFKVYYNEDGFTEAILADNNHIKVIKIHGSIASQKSIRVTIETIASENLLTKRKEMVEHIFTSPVNNYLIFLGYSFSDKFDITPHIGQINGKLHPQIIVIDHVSDDRIAFDNIHSVSAFKEKDASGYKVTINTGTFMNMLAENLLPETLRNQPAELAIPFKDEKVEWKSILDDWLNKAVNPNAKYLSCSKLAQELGNDYLQNKYAGLAAQRLASMPRDRWYYLVAIQSIFSDSRLSDSNINRVEIIRRYEDLKLDLEKNQKVEHDDRQRLLSTIVYQTAREVENTGADVWSALYLYKNCFRLDQSTNDKKGMAKALHQMAFVLLRSEDNERFNWFNKCIRLLKASISLKHETGNLSGVSLSLFEMGNAYYTNKEYALAIQHYRESEALGREIGEYWLKGRMLTMIGTAYHKMSEQYLEEAAKYLNESIIFKEELPVNTSLAISYNNYGDVLAMQEQYKDSISFYKKAIAIYKETNHISAARCMLNLLYLLRKIGNNYDAVYFSELEKEFTTAVNLVADPPTRKKFEKQFAELNDDI